MSSLPIRRAATALALALALAPLPSLAAPAAPAPAASAPARAQAPVDINTATDEQLQALPKIGPAISQRILDYRKQVGGFKTVDELRNVQGIGDKTLEILRPLVTVGTAPAAKAKS